MKEERSTLGNKIVNIAAVVILLGVIYSAVTFIIIPVSKFIWAASTTAVKDGYQQFITTAETFVQWDMAFYLLIGLSIYLVPTIIAFTKKHHSKRSIFFVNALFGWSLIGWVLALIWCLSSPQPAEQHRI